MTNEQQAIERLVEARRFAKEACYPLTENGESDEAAMKTVAVVDAINLAIAEINLRARAMRHMPPVEASK